ncbi:hypothetical protein JAAARDRAFT_111832, partial [Jaapia argillacea MUCL 33604]
NVPMGPVAPQTRFVPRSTPLRQGGGEMQCYACNEMGHMMSGCGKLNELLTQGLAHRDGGGRVVLADGSRIRKGEGETLVVAIERSVPQTNLITCEMESSRKEMALTNVVEIWDDEKADVFPVERVERKSANRRREVMEGVYMPPKPDWARKIDKGKGRETETRISPSNPPPAPPAVVITTPIDIHPQPAFNSEDSDTVMED